MLSVELLFAGMVRVSVVSFISLIASVGVLRLLRQPLERVRLIQISILGLVALLLVSCTETLPAFGLPVLSSPESAAPVVDSPTATLKPTTLPLGNSQPIVESRSEGREPVLTPPDTRESISAEYPVRTVSAAQPATTRPVLRSNSTEPADDFNLFATLQTVFVYGFIICCLLNATYLIVGFLMTCRLIAGAKPLSEDDVARIDQIAQELSRQNRVRFFTSAHIDVPVVAGIWRPTVLLPEAFINGHPTQLKHAIAHEWSHIQRRDVLTWYVFTLCQTVLWIQPGYWILRRELRLAQDQIADQFAADATGQPVSYVTSLFEVSQTRRRFPAGVLTMSGGHSNLYRRIEMLTNEEFRVARVTRKFVVLALASLSVFLGTMTAAVQLTHAASVSPGNNQEKTDNSGNDRTARFPQFVFAEHVTLRDGKIVTFMDALAELDRLHHAKTPGLFVSWTEGMRGGATETKNSKDLFDFLVIHQMPAAGLGKDGHRYDLIRTAADLGFAAGTGVAGKVQGTDGKPLSGVTLALVPLNPPYGPGLIQRKKVSISNGRLMQPARYETARSNVKGEFVLHPSAVMHPTVLNWAVVAIHETGIAWLEDESLTDGKPLRLRKWSRLSGKVGANGADTVRLELQHSSDLRSIGFRIPVALQADSRFSATHVPPGKVVPWRYPKNNPQIVADAPVTLKPGRGRVLFLNKAAARKKVASPSMRAQPELGDMDAVEFKAYAPKQLERSRMSWAPVLIEIAEPDDPVCKDLRDRFVNREVIAHALKKGRFDVFTVAPESEIGHDLIAELAGEDEEPPRFAIYPKDRFAKATVLRAPITAHRFLDAITKAAASPREKVLPLIVAKHALIYQDRLIKWSQFENTIRRVARTSNARPALYVTRGGTEKAARLQQGLAKLKREINFHNFTVGSLGSRASSRWDAVRSPDDLRPDGQTLIGRVVAPDKEEIDGVAEIVLLRKDQEATLRFNGTHVANPLEEELYRSDQTGRFQLPVPDEDRRFVVTHAAGFVVLDRSQLLRDQGLIQLKPWGTLTGTLAPWHGYQVLDITSTLPGTRIRIQKTESIKYGENIYRVSPGELTVQRSLRISGSAPHKFEPEKFRLDSGQSEAVTVAEFPQDVLKKVVAANRKVRDSRESARKKRIE